MPFAYSEKTSDGLNEVSREVTRVVNRGVEGSWIPDASTIAIHNDDLK
jgi:hypothetical protein